ncbi:hypothetical protein HG537_0D02180 [Torulaspora globosa]|uniref:PH domain-containing protein n=1 Tax=Torulaspora globosa TaxID=48254 RepID=A0A7H9HU14_9SACH|nr:hypothetical protein HG537_0D02180 [Torulaspora sp. CBS 2947]
MSDYFSLGRDGNETRVELSSNDANRVKSGGFDREDDRLSIHSNDSYLLELLPESSISGNQVPSEVSSGISSAAISSVKGSKDHILPRWDRRSPYYVDVPVPKPSSIDAGESGTAAESDSAEGKYVREYPTDILVDRFYKWRKVLKGLIAYLREVAYAQEQFGRVNFQLKSAVKFPFLTDLEDGSNRLVDPLASRGPAKKQQPVTLAQKKQQESSVAATGVGENSLNNTENEFQAVRTAESDDTSASSGFMKFGSGSVQDIQVILKKYHLSLAHQQFKISKEITTTVIPKMEDLRKDLQLKIREIKELHGDFKTNINEHVAITGQLLNKYIASVKFVTNNFSSDGSDHIKLHKKNNQLKPKHDPYLLKLQLDLQLKRQLLEENYLQEAYINLQTSGMELEKIIYSKVQHALQKYCLLIDSEARLMIKNLCRELQQGMLSRPPALEWDHFVSHHPTCLLNWKSNDPVPPARKLSEIIYPQMKSPLAKCIRAGYLSKKSKYLKNYNKGYFVLTSNYLHEFKSSNFFKVTNSSEETKDHQNVSTAAQSSTKTSLIPVMSISLNDCVLMEASEHKFVLVGVPTFNDFQKVSNSTKGSLTSIAGTSSPTNEGPKKLKKAAFGKLLKGGKSKQSAPKTAEEQEEMKQFYAAARQETNKTVNWVFKPASSNPSEEEIRLFKKWIHDLRNLTSFNNTEERSKFIEERVLKAQTRVKSIPKGSASTSSMSALGEGSNVDGSSFKKERPGRPKFIQLQNSPASSSALDISAYRSKVNTPAVDDNGNLITVAERRHIPASLYMTSPITSPRMSPGSDSSSAISLVHQQLHQQSQQAADPQQPQADTSGHNLVMNTAPVVSGVPVGESYRRHHRNTSLTQSLPGVNVHSISAINSPKSINSEGSSGGYFAIPVARSNDGSEGSTPSYADDRISQSYAPPNGNRGLAMRSISGGYSPQLVNLHSQAPSPVPKLRLNDQDVAHSAVDETQTTQVDSSLAYNRFKRNQLLGDVPSTKSDSTLASGSPSLYLRSNNSTNSLGSTASRTHPIRKHKKNVSFSSLNSLMFSKKAANAGGSHMTDQFMSGGIREDDDDSEKDSHCLKLNQSIYS